MTYWYFRWINDRIPKTYLMSGHHNNDSFGSPLISWAILALIGVVVFVALLGGRNINLLKEKESKKNKTTS